jgi:hypothetical protein
VTEIALDSDRNAIGEMARAFADEKLAPHALAWDEEKTLSGRRHSRSGGARHGRGQASAVPRSVDLTRRWFSKRWRRDAPR